MTQHTPGPWTAVDLDGKPVNDPSIMSAKHCVATVWINSIPRKQAGANAVLMALAPELLEVLRDLHAHCTAPDEYMRAAEFVLAKVDGGTP